MEYRRCHGYVSGLEKWSESFSRGKYGGFGAVSVAMLG